MKNVVYYYACAGAAGAARRQGQGGRQRERRGGERGGRRVAHARGLGVLQRGALALHGRRRAVVIPAQRLHSLHDESEQGLRKPPRRLMETTRIVAESHYSDTLYHYFELYLERIRVSM